MVSAARETCLRIRRDESGTAPNRITRWATSARELHRKSRWRKSDFPGLPRNLNSHFGEFGIDTPHVAVGYSRQLKRCPMKTRAFSVLALAVGFLIASAPVFAHHGASAYD